MAKTNKYDKQHIRNLSAYERQIDEIYKEAVREAAALGISIRDFNPDKLFSFDDYPATRKRIDKLLSGLKSDLTAVIVNGVRSEWTLANNKNNELARLVFGDNVGKLTQEQYRRYFSTNSKALDAFLSRKASGLNLSDRVWKYTNQFKVEIELGLDVGIRNGLSADEMSRELRDYLRHTDKLFRRVRDEHGILQLSKRAAAFHPGQGVYRSSYKNARRLAATETNMAYRASDYERWQQFDFVVGIEIKLSNNHTLNGHPFHDICDELQGKYPKDFKFTGWHPHCRCHAVTILKTEEELMADNERIMAGGEPDDNSKNSVNGLPGNYLEWMNENADRIKQSEQRGTLPYFIRDNRTLFPSLDSAGRTGKFTMSGRNVDNMLKKGWRFDVSGDIAEKYNNSPIAGFNIEEFTGEFTGIFEKEGIPVSNVKRLVINSDSAQFRLGKYSDDLMLVRTFSVENGNKKVSHDLFVMPDKAQGKGLSKKVFKSLYKQYQNAGVKSIDVCANIDIGGYTWARYGFCAKKDDVYELLNKRKWNIGEKNFTDAVSTVNNFYKTGEAGKFPMNLLADKKYGKELLLGTTWNGSLDLANEAQRMAFEKYLFR